MKKLGYIALLAIVLASCSKTEQTPVETPTTDTTSSDTTSSVENTSNEELNENIALNETSNGESTSTEVTSTESTWETATVATTQSSSEKVNFDAGYTIPNGMNVSMTWYLEVKDWVIVWVGWMENAQGPQKNFAEWVWAKVIWKEIKGLQIDTISWASLTTAAFNKYLETNYWA